MLARRRLELFALRRRRQQQRLIALCDARQRGSDLDRRHVVFLFVLLDQLLEFAQVALCAHVADALLELADTHVVDHVDRRQLHLFDRLARGAFDRAQHAALARADKQDRLTAATGATGAADAMHVAFGVVRDVVIEHVADAVYIEATRSDIGSDEDIQLAVLQLLDHPLALWLRDIAVDRRSGDAILFVTPRERGMLHAIERATRQPIEQMQLPSVEAVNDKRITKFKQRISDTLSIGDLGQFQQLIEQYEQEHNVPAIEIAAALARIAQGDQPLLLAPPPKRERAEYQDREQATPERGARRDSERRAAPAAHGDTRPARAQKPYEGKPREFGTRPAREHITEPGKRTYRIEVGHDHGVKPGNIVGAIANEAGLESRHMGRLSIRGEYSLIDLPDGMPKEIFEHLKKVWVSQQQLRIHEWDGKDGGSGGGEADAAPARKPVLPKPHESRPGGKPRPRSNDGAKPPRRK